MAEEAAKCEMVLIRLGSEEGPAKEFSKQVSSLIQKETTVAPKEWSSSNMKTSQLLSFQVGFPLI